MKNSALILLLMLCFTSCKSSKTSVANKSEPVIHKETEPGEPSSTLEKNEISEAIAPAETNASKFDGIVDYAKQFDGVGYKFGGTSKKGMDCSGLVFTVFKSENIVLPRRSKDMAAIGNRIDVEEVKKGDLLFFATRKNSRDINHVGLVTEVRPGFVEFIHSTINAGVIISNLAERYWYVAFVQARRIL